MELCFESRNWATYYVDENDEEVYTLIRSKMYRDKIDVTLLSKVSSALKQHCYMTTRIYILLYDLIQASFKSYRMECNERRRVFSHCLLSLCRVKDIRRLLLEYLIKTEDAVGRLEDTIRFCHRQFVREESIDKRNPLDWFAYALKCSQEASRLLEAFSPLLPFSSQATIRFH